MPNGVLWTIPVQIQFFVLAPFLLRWLKKGTIFRSKIAVIVLTVISILLEQSKMFLPEIIYKLMGVTVLPYLYFLVAGMVGWIHRDAIIPSLKRKRWIILASFLIWKLAENAFAFPHVLDGVMYNTLTTLLTAIVIFSFAFCGSWRMKYDLTYGFYLYHMVFVNLVLYYSQILQKQLQHKGMLVVGIATLSSGCAVLSQRYVEKPVVKVLSKRV